VFGVGCFPFSFKGTNVIPHFGHCPGPGRTTSGCIGQVYRCAYCAGGEAFGVGVGSAKAAVAAHVMAAAIKIKICSLMSMLKLICCICGKRQPRRLPYNLVVNDREWRSLGARRRSVCAHARNQFKERRCAWRSGGERFRRRRNFESGEDGRLFNCEIGADKSDNCRREALGWRCHNSAQNFAARLHVRTLRFDGLRMERTSVFDRIRLCCDRVERAMIGNCDPGRNGDKRDNAARRNGHRLHSSFNRRINSNAQTVSS